MVSRFLVFFFRDLITSKTSIYTSTVKVDEILLRRPCCSPSRAFHGTLGNTFKIIGCSSYRGGHV